MFIVLFELHHSRSYLAFVISSREQTQQDDVQSQEGKIQYLHREDSVMMVELPVSLKEKTLASSDHLSLLL